METFFEDSEYIIERCLYYLYLHIYTNVSTFLLEWNLYHRAGLSDILQVNWSNKKSEQYYLIILICELVSKSPSRGYVAFWNFLNNSEIKVLVVPFRETFPSTDCFQLNRYTHDLFVQISEINRKIVSMTLLLRTSNSTIDTKYRKYVCSTIYHSRCRP